MSKDKPPRPVDHDEVLRWLMDWHDTLDEVEDLEDKRSWIIGKMRFDDKSTHICPGCRTRLISDDELIMYHQDVDMLAEFIAYHGTSWFRDDVGSYQVLNLFCPWINEDMTTFKVRLWKSPVLPDGHTWIEHGRAGCSIVKGGLDVDTYQ